MITGETVDNGVGKIGCTYTTRKIPPRKTEETRVEETRGIGYIGGEMAPEVSVDNSVLVDEGGQNGRVLLYALHRGGISRSGMEWRRY
jgi:hypothetical protein